MFESTLDYARKLDSEDRLASFRDKFYIPKSKGRDSIYLNGNSLGLLPKTAESYIQQELKDWANLGGHAHFDSKIPWVSYHKIFRKPLSVLCGAKEIEVAAMNSLTVNLHLLLVSFYRPTNKRYKILVEKGAFSSDQYATETQVRFHNLDPDETIIEVGPREGEFLIRDEDIVAAIEEQRDVLALILIGGVNFYTGQVFDMKTITDAGHSAGAFVGFDLAHAIGNVELKLHEWNVDFAVWCSYKYLNSGPGGVGGIFVNERFSRDELLPRFGGWWGHQEDVRFKMEKGFKPIEGADGWHLSNVPILSMAVHKASLDIFMEAGMENLRKKSLQLTGFLEYLLNTFKGKFKIISPTEEDCRGCQLSLYFEYNIDVLVKKLTDEGVIFDERRPNVIRLAPVPMYNSFEDVYRFYEILKKVLQN